MARVTLTPTEMSAGVAPNVIPREVRLGINCRTLPSTAPEDCVRYVESLVRPEDRGNFQMEIEKHSRCASCVCGVCQRQVPYHRPSSLLLLGKGRSPAPLRRCRPGHLGWSNGPSSRSFSRYMGGSRAPEPQGSSPCFRS